MKKIIFSLLTAISLTASPFNIYAENLNYEFVQVSLYTIDGDVSGVDFDGNGYAFGTSIKLHQNFAFEMSMQRGSADFDVDTDTTSIGMNSHLSVLDNTDLVLAVSYLIMHISQPEIGLLKDEGNDITLGVRNRISDNIEIGIYASEVDIFDESSTSYDFQFIFGPPNGIQYSISYGKSDDANSVGISIRMNGE